MHVTRFLSKLADFFRKVHGKSERAFLEHFFNQLQSTATGERAQSIKEIERLNDTVAQNSK